ncbi:hypothetical protein JCM8202_004828 [Rhodotorula sphaerocarpa]
MDASSASSSPRRKRSAKSLALSDDDDDLSNEALKRVSIAKIRCDGKQPSCSTCVKNRKTGCTYTRVTPEENLEVKAKKRLAREQKAHYKALGIEPPPKLTVGRRRWEQNIRFEQQKLRGVSQSKEQDGAELGDQQAAAAMMGSPAGFSTSTWRIGDVVRQIAYSAPATTQEASGYFASNQTTSMPPRGPYFNSASQAPMAYSFPPMKPFSGPLPAYSPYPLTPPMEPGQTSPMLDGNNALGLFSPPAVAGVAHDWIAQAHAAAAAMPTVLASARVPSLRLQRGATFQPAPKPLAQVPAQPEPLAFVPSSQPAQACSVPYPSPVTSARLLPTSLPSSQSYFGPPVPLYAPNPTRPAATCDLIARIGASPPPQQSQTCEAGVKAKKEASMPAHSRTSPPPSSLGPAADASTTTSGAVAGFPSSTSTSGPAYASPADDSTMSIATAVPMLPSTSWSGSEHTPLMRSAPASYAADNWPLSEPHAHSTPEVYSQAVW